MPRVLSPSACGAILLALAGYLVPSSSGAVSPTDVPFTVAKYPVQATATDGVAAKKMALAEGQEAAFRSLLKRIVPVNAYAQLSRLEIGDASQYLQGVAVRRERNSSTAYIATLDFTFSARGVREFLKREGIPFIDTQAAPITLIPLVALSATTSDPRLGAAWTTAWQGLDLERALAPAKLASLTTPPDPSVEAAVKKGDVSGLLAAAGVPPGDRAVIALAEVDRTAGRLTLTLIGADTVGPLRLKRTYRIEDGDLSYAMEYAAVITLGILEGRFKAITAEARGGIDVMAGPGLPVALEAQFSSLGEWTRLRETLTATPGVENIEFGSVSPRSAEISLLFPGGAQQLSAVVARQGLSLVNEGSIWILKSRF